MSLLKAIRDADIGADFPAPPSYRDRQACRAVVFDNEGKVALLNVTQKSYHKLPGRGIEPGEDHETALRREVLEETGCAIDNIRKLGTVEEYRNKPGIHQISYCFVADTADRKGTTDLDAYEIDHGFRLEWLDIESAIRTMERHLGIEDYDAKFIALRDLTFLGEAINEHLKPAFSILAALDNAPIEYWVFGGVSIAAAAGHFFRKNRDIDLFVKEDDFVRTKSFLEQECAKHNLELRYHAPKRASDKPKLDLIPKGRRRGGSHDDLLSVVPVYREDDNIIFRYPKPETYKIQILDRIERRIGNYRFFAPPDQCIKDIFKNHMRVRCKKRKNPLYIADAKHILLPEDFTELNWKI